MHGSNELSSVPWRSLDWSVIGNLSPDSQEEHTLLILIVKRSARSNLTRPRFAACLDFLDTHAERCARLSFQRVLSFFPLLKPRELGVCSYKPSNE